MSFVGFRKKPVQLPPVRMPPPRKVPEENNDCEVEIKKTRTGKKIKISGKCSKDQIRAISEANGLRVSGDYND